MLMRVNLGMLAYLWEESEMVRRIAATERGTDRGTERVAADAVVAEAQDEEIAEVLSILKRKLATVGPRKAGPQQKWFSQRRAKLLPAVRDIGEADGELVMDSEGTWFAVDPKTGERIVPPKVGEETRRQAEECARMRAEGASV